MPDLFPCRVNDLLLTPPRQCRSLAGRWEFILDAGRRLTAAQAARARATHRLLVPGFWEAQGVGGPGRLTRTMFTTDRFRGVYRGLGWYRRRFDAWPIAPDHRLWLKLGVVHGAASVFLNGRAIGTLSRTLGAYRLEITEACRPAGNLLLVAVDNDLEPSGGAGDIMGVLGGLAQGVDIERTSGTWIAALCVTGDLPNRAASGWIELRSGMAAGAESAGDTLHLTVRAQGAGARPRELVVRVPPGRGGSAIRVPFTLPVPDARPWAPETPALYRLTARLLRRGTVLDAAATRFGFRSLAVRGTCVLLNGHPFFMAGCGTMTHTPETVGPTADLRALRRTLRRMKAHGFVYVRYHTETPYAELFDAADEVGILVQPENRPFQSEGNMPVQSGGEIEWGPGGPAALEAETRWHIQETALIHAHLSNHPSLAVYCMGNEYFDRKLPARTRWHAAVKAMDPTRLAISADGNTHWFPQADDYVAGYHCDPAVLRAAPVVLHEFISVPTLPDPREARRFTGGTLMPETLRRYLNWARRCGIRRARLRRLSVASHHLQAMHVKYGMETARAIPGIQGYGVWRYHDFWRFPTRMGIVTAHGADKDRTPDSLCASNHPSVLIANVGRGNMCINGMPMGHALHVYGARRCEGVRRNGQATVLTVYAAHTGANAIRGGELAWRITDGRTVLASGRSRAIRAAPGTITRCATLRLRMPAGRLPHAVRLEATLASSAARIANAWPLWSFPETPPVRGSDLAACGAAGDYVALDPAVRRIRDTADLADADAGRMIVVSDSLAYDGLDAFVRRGGRVWLVSARDFPGQPVIAHPGWWSAGPHRFTGAVLERHPVLAHWPESRAADWPFVRFFSSKEAFEFPERLDGGVLPTTVVPVFARRAFGHDAIAYGVRGIHANYICRTIDVRYDWMPYLFEWNVGPGRIFGCMLRLRNDPLAGNWLAGAILDYLRSDAFRPKARAAWRQVCPARARNVAENCPVYYHREGESDTMFLHGRRRGTGYTLFTILARHPAWQVMQLGHYVRQDPPTVFLDLCAPWRIGRVALGNGPNGGARRVRLSAGLSEDRWEPLGLLTFPNTPAARLTLDGRGLPARFVKIECLDRYPSATAQSLSLGPISVFPSFARNLSP